MGLYLGFYVHRPSRLRVVNNGQLAPIKRSIVIPETLLSKLEESNRRDLGSQHQRGQLFSTPVDIDILSVVNAYLRTGLTTEELQLILAHRAYFEFKLGVGDRRNITSFVQRFAVADNWAGEDVNARVLTPDIDGDYRHTLTFSAATRRIKVTDTHSGDNRWGSVRYLTIRYLG